MSAGCKEATNVVPEPLSFAAAAAVKASDRNQPLS